MEEIKKQDSEETIEELITKIKAVEVNKKEGLVFFGRCHCSCMGNQDNDV